MAKLAQLAAVKSAKTDNFVYIPPDSAFNAARILLKVNLGFGLGTPPAVNMGVLAAVLRGLRRVSPLGRILMIDRICPASSAERIFAQTNLPDYLDAEMRFAPVDDLPPKPYATASALSNLSSSVSEINAPAYLEDFDCVLNLTSFEVAKAQVRASLEGLQGLLACADALELSKDERRYDALYSALAPHIDAWIVDIPFAPKQEAQVVWGESALAVDEVVCRLTNTTPAPYINHLGQHKFV